MRKLFVLSSILLVFCVSVFCQVADSTVSLPGQIADIVNSMVGKDLTYKIILIAAIVGTILHIVIDTYKGVTQSTTSPYQFVLSYWIKDNVLAKLVSILAFILSISTFTDLLAKLPSGLFGYAIISVVGFAIGYFIDYLSSLLKGLIPTGTVK